MSGHTPMAMTRPIHDFAGTDVLTVTSELMVAERPFALGIVIEAKGSTSARVGAKAIFDDEGTVMCGWVGGGCAESTIAHTAVEGLKSKIPQVVDVDLDDEVLGAGMPYGGNMRLYVEPAIPPPALWIRGHGRVAECLCHLGALLSLEVVVDDTMASPDRYPEANRLIVDDPGYGALRPSPIAEPYRSSRNGSGQSDRHEFGQSSQQPGLGLHVSLSCQTMRRRGSMNEKMNSSRGCFERHDDEAGTYEYASPRCFMREMHPAYFGLAPPTTSDWKLRDPGVIFNALVITRALLEKIASARESLRMSIAALRRSFRTHSAR
jgi:hypothetical protein